MVDIEINWPLDLRPAQQSFYIRTLTTKFENPLTGQVQVLERDAARWVSKISLIRNELDARRLEALLALSRAALILPAVLAQRSPLRASRPKPWAF